MTEHPRHVHNGGMRYAYEDRVGAIIKAGSKATWSGQADRLLRGHRTADPEACRNAVGGDREWMEWASMVCGMVLVAVVRDEPFRGTRRRSSRLYRIQPSSP
jgi:hypothetical protein